MTAPARRRRGSTLLSGCRGGSRCCFFFQAEDGIRDGTVTGVQTCALPICSRARARECGGPRPREAARRSRRVDTHCWSGGRRPDCEGADLGAAYRGSRRRLGSWRPRAHECGACCRCKSATRQAVMPPPPKRCSWTSAGGPLLLQYHDDEWGVPVHRDRKHFEVLVLSGAQAGLSWSLVLKKREGYRRAFDNFDPEKVARYSARRIQRLTSDPEIIRNRMKIEAAVRNARVFLKIEEEFGDFDSYCWRFVGGRPKLNRWKATRQIPATSPESVAFSKDLKHRGFSFVGPTVVYAYMQAVGMVNDHLVDCFRYREISRLRRSG